MRGKGYLNLEITYRKAAERLACRLPADAALNSGAVFREEKKVLLLTFLGQEYRINYPQGEVWSTEKERAPLYTSVLLLHYLVHAKGSPLKGEWISFKELPGGHIYKEPFFRRAINPLLKTFSSSPEKFLQGGEKLGGFRAIQGDYSIVIPALPRVPVNLVLWQGDEELPPNAAILFDASAPDYLPTEDYAHLSALVIQAVKKKMP